MLRENTGRAIWKGVARQLPIIVLCFCFSSKTGLGLAPTHTAASPHRRENLPSRRARFGGYHWQRLSLHATAAYLRPRPNQDAQSRSPAFFDSHCPSLPRRFFLFHPVPALHAHDLYTPDASGRLRTKTAEPGQSFFP